MTKEEVETLISERYQSLPPKLKLAARHVLDSPKDIAIQSMRSVAADAKLQPAAMLRLARELGFDSYEAFRALYVTWLSSGETTFAATGEDGVKNMAILDAAFKSWKSGNREQL